MKQAPHTVYRLQLNEHFPLKKATKLLPYLKELGVDGVYCSPYFAAFSPHGYDIIDPNKLNPLVASEEDFKVFCKELKRLNLFHLADIVPNHMGIRGDNLWWHDVLLHGKKSPYASYFDLYKKGDKILLPFLGDTVEIIRTHGKLFVRTGGLTFPLQGDQLPKTEKETQALLEAQHYRLVDWKHAAKETSYRRFFNIGDLIGMRMEDSKVLAAHHKWIFTLLKKGVVDGLRVDHPDGLYDPAGYFTALRAQTDQLIVVEKILGWGEELPKNWKVDGTVGYEFLGILTGLFIEKGEELTKIYKTFTGQKEDFDKVLLRNKEMYARDEMAGDVAVLADELVCNLSKEEKIEAIYALLAAFPVYRSYIAPDGKQSSQDKSQWEETKKRNPSAYKQVEKHLFQKKNREFLLRFQQLSAPVMAKGLEDITLYQYNRLLACNEVGSEPERGGVDIDEFHAFCKRKREKWPLGLLPVSTHDTKRSMDVRMQIACLSEIPKEWEAFVQKLAKQMRPYKTKIGGKLFPDANTEYALYQTLLGIWPARPTFKRLWPILQKSVREARVYTSWMQPHECYETACKRFLKGVLSHARTLSSFQTNIQEKGEWKSLSATSVQLGAPGIVDLYQGSEDFLYLLVDPDNRQVASHPKKDSIKTALMRKALHFRTAHKELFLQGEYIPIQAGKQTVAYLRTYKKIALLVAAPTRHFHPPKGKILLPTNLGTGQDLFTAQTFSEKTIDQAKLFRENPFAWVIYSR